MYKITLLIWIFLSWNKSVHSCISLRRSKPTIYVWIQNWDQYRSVAVAEVVACLLENTMRKKDVYPEHELKLSYSYLDEVRVNFIVEFRLNIRTSMMWRIIDEAGLTRKVIERRVLEISVKDIIRFCFDLLSLLSWTYQNLVFLDEVGFDNRII